MGDLLDGYSTKIEAAFQGQPEIEARIRTTIGNSYLTLYYFEAGSQREKPTNDRGGYTWRRP